MHRDGESSAGAVAKKMNRDGESGHKSKQRQRQRMHRDARAGQTTHRLDEATAATEQMHRAGESSAYYARIQLSNGSDRACIATASRADYASVRWSKGSNRACIAVVYWQPQTARAAQTMHHYGGGR